MGESAMRQPIKDIDKGIANNHSNDLNINIKLIKLKLTLDSMSHQFNKVNIKEYRLPL